MTAKLIYTAMVSLDLFVADENDNFDWAATDAEILAFVNDIERPIGTYLYGRRLYETMRVWEHLEAIDDRTPEMDDYGEIWLAADKVVFSTTLAEVTTARTRLERSFDAAEISALKASSDKDISIGGPHLAAEALRAHLVDEIRVFVNPIVIGGGNAVIPHSLVQRLELLQDHRFASGVVYLRYAVA